eukprot:scaffold234_cov406-Prasinococcus_capsulatus_cf.AAC.13
MEYCRNFSASVGRSSPYFTQSYTSPTAKPPVESTDGLLARALAKQSRHSCICETGKDGRTARGH